MPPPEGPGNPATLYVAGVPGVTTPHPERYRSVVADARGDSLPELTYVGGHPTVPDTQRIGQVFCVACGSVGGDPNRRCVRGLVVHLVDPLDITDDPDRWKTSPWTQPETLAAARTWWLDRAAVITRAPREHPRFQVCPTCTTARIHAGEIPFTLPAPRPPVVTRK